MSGEATFTLEFPIQGDDGQAITTLTLRRPLAGATEQFLNKMRTQGTALLELVARCTERTPDEIRRLDAADFARIANRVQDFLPAASQTSEE